jgi:hypothetical protein
MGRILLLMRSVRQALTAALFQISEKRFFMCCDAADPALQDNLVLELIR